MSLRFQRLLLIFLSLIFLTASIFLILFNSKKNLIFFYTPSELLNSKTQINDTIRIGGIVKKDSLKNIMNNLSEDHYFILKKFINRGFISKYRLKNINY